MKKISSLLLVLLFFSSTALAAGDLVVNGNATVGGQTTMNGNAIINGSLGGGVTPGQRLSVAGTIESTTGGFKFPDGSMQTETAKRLVWDYTVPSATQPEDVNVKLHNNSGRE